MSSFSPGEVNRHLAVASAGCRLVAELRGKGPPVVFIQGVGVHGAGWLPQVEALKGEFACLSFDNRGLGRSLPAGDELSVERLADDVRLLMGEAGWEDAHLVGHSLGGLVVLELAISSPERARSLALVCTAASGRDLVRMTWWSFQIGLRIKLGPRKRRRRAFLEMVMPATDLADADHERLARDLAPRFGYDLADQPLIALKQAMAARAYDPADRLAELSRMPTLVVSGSEDRMAPARLGADLSRRIPHARFVELHGAAHGLTIHRADEVNGLLRDHLMVAEQGWQRRFA